MHSCGQCYYLQGHDALGQTVPRAFTVFRVSLNKPLWTPAIDNYGEKLLKKDQWI